MSLLLLFHPGVPASPQPPEMAVELPQGGGAVFAHHQVRKKRIQQDEDELIEIIALVVPLIGRH